LPKIAENPDLVYALGYQLQHKKTGEYIPWDDVDFDRVINLNLKNYQIRQKPGRYNALGLARISIKNPHAIFMHGTPDTYLFNRASRSLSSGCVRLQDPLKMSKFVLENKENYDEQKIEDLYHLKKEKFGKTKYISIKEELLVHLTYLTAWIDETGATHFAPDIYDRDAKLMDAYNKL
jgi:murein L,D-transpeptidase YcbB/YkuD